MACGAKTEALGTASPVAIAQEPGPEDAPLPGCVPLGAAPKLLLSDAGFSVYAMLPDGDRLWLSGTTPDKSAPRLREVNVRTGVDAWVDADGFGGGRVARWGAQLAYVQGTPNTSTVALLDLDTGTQTSAANPNGASSAEGLVADGSGVYWLTRTKAAPSQLTVVRRDRASNVRVLTALRNYTTLHTDEKEVFYTRYVGTAMRFEAVPIGGGEPRTLKGFRDLAFQRAIVLVDATRVWYVEQETGGHGVNGAGALHSIEKNGTNDRIWLRNQFFSGFNFNGDPAWFYWIDSTRPNGVMRVRLRESAEVERIETGPQRWVNTIASDRCNVYWSVVNPPALYGRSR
jgi:hypothetical protein